MKQAAGRVAGALLLGATAVMPAASAERVFADAGCDFAESESGTVDAILDGTTLRLSDGRELRLAGVEVPPGEPGAAERQQAASAILSDFVGAAIELRYGSVRTDRYGRATAQAFAIRDGAEVWLQAELLEQGTVRVAGFADDRACLGAMLEHERMGRDAGLGFWRELAPMSAFAPSRGEVDGLYELVEGRVELIGRTERTVYLNFGRNWATDFTVTMTAATARALEAEGGPLDALAGRRVRVRGWLTQRDGPWIVVDHPEQIEILDVDADEAGASANGLAGN